MMAPKSPLDIFVENLRQRNFNKEKLAILEDISEALCKSITGRCLSDDQWFGKRGFFEYFSNVLLIHHATNADKFKKKAFEFAFRGACRSLGLSAAIHSNQVNPGDDVTVNGVKFSLKTEAEATISRQRIKISKLMEARWIRNLSNDNERGAKAISHVLRHLENYERILTLRAFDLTLQDGGGAVEYQLWEIPKAVLERIRTLREESFSAVTANNSFSAKVTERVGHTTKDVFSLRMDGSVEKITISGLDTNYCTCHAQWIVPVVSDVAE